MPSALKSSLPVITDPGLTAGWFLRLTLNLLKIRAHKFFVSMAHLCLKNGNRFLDSLLRPGLLPLGLGPQMEARSSFKTDSPDTPIT